MWHWHNRVIIGSLFCFVLATGVSMADDSSDKAIRSGRILVENEDFDGAGALLRPLLEQNPGNSQLLYFVAVVDEAQGKLSDAIKGYTACINASSPTDLVWKQATAAVQRFDEGKKVVARYVKLMEQEAGILKPKNNAAAYIVMQGVQSLQGDGFITNTAATGATKQPTGGKSGASGDEAAPSSAKVVFLADMQERDVVAHDNGWFGKKGWGGGSGRITCNGRYSPNGIGLHPTSTGVGSVRYDLNGGNFKQFVGAVALNDSVDRSATPVIFSVVGDGQVLWKSKPIQNSRQSQAFRIGLGQTKTLELQVQCGANCSGAHGIWIEPFLTK